MKIVKINWNYTKHIEHYSPPWSGNFNYTWNGTEYFYSNDSLEQKPDLIIKTEFQVTIKIRNIKFYWGGGDFSAYGDSKSCTLSNQENGDANLSVSNKFYIDDAWAATRRELHIKVTTETGSHSGNHLYCTNIVKMTYYFNTPNIFEWIAPFFSFDIDFSYNVSYTIGEHYDPIIPHNIEDPNAQQWQFYLNYQKQIWFNKLLTNEEIDLLPIESKKYDIINLFKTIKDLNETTLERENYSLTDKYNNTTSAITSSINNLIAIPITESHTYIDMDRDVIYVDGIFLNFQGFQNEKKENFTMMYDYILCKGFNHCLIENNNKVEFDKVNAWFLIPIRKLENVSYSNNIWGNDNTLQNLKTVTQIASENSISVVYSSPISPFIFAFYNRSNISALFGAWNVSNDNKNPEILKAQCGLFNIHKEGKKYGAIVITNDLVKIWLEKNKLIEKTFNYLSLINLNSKNLPTIWENEPILYSPQILISYIKSINNSFNPIGNDLLNLKYQIIFWGLIMSGLQGNTVMLHVNYFNPKRILSMSKNELCSLISGEIAFSTNAWTNWLNTHQTTQDTSYKIYNLTANQRKDNYDTENYLRTMNLIKGGISGITQIAMTAITGGYGASGAIGKHFIESLPENISGGTLSKMKAARPIASTTEGGIGLVGDMVFGGLTEAKRRQNSYNQMTTNNKIDKLNLDSEFSNIKLSSGKDFILPSFQSGAFAQDSGLYLYTLEARQEYKKQIGIDRLMNGVPVNEILPYNNFDNRQIYNIISLNCNFNYLTIYNHLKNYLIVNNNKLMRKFHREFIEYFMNNYLTGITIFKKYQQWRDEHWKIDNNFENDIMTDENNLDDD